MNKKTRDEFIEDAKEKHGDKYSYEKTEYVNNHTKELLYVAITIYLMNNLQSYIDEAVYRWNTRKMSESERFAHMFKKVHLTRL